MSPTELLLSALTGVLTISTSAFGWWLISLHNRHEKLRADHEDLRVRVADEYCRRVDLRDMMDDMKQDIHQAIAALREDMRAGMGRAHAGR
ncbi:hypothetical protein JFK97_06895 [Chromobacterium phragmitis]|uniref:hypothetical protein n=1 Tax=Chromobacterium amazonense TaxID=1382803 RepID=UPI0021B7AA02|nr:hypothetical protein [Chromobacterium amazonense]MBM2884115.1 hypothetical protein [Chromobacterium amazonense]MDE1715759.1 hypothetical protein [Chromobacterium amazonense]